MRKLFILHATLSFIIILDVIVGRIVKQPRSDIYDTSVVSSVFAYWSKSPKFQSRKKDDKLLKPKDE